MDCDFVLVGQNDQMLKEHASMSHSDNYTEDEVRFLMSTDMHDLLDAKILEIEIKSHLILLTHS